MPSRSRFSPTRTAFVLLFGIVLATATACSGSSSDDAARPAADRLAAAKTAFDGAKSVTLDLTSKDVPPQENGVTAAAGQGVISAEEPKFAGTVTATIGGVGGTVDVIAVGAQTYMKFFTPDYVATDFAELGAPNPALLFSPETGISTLLSATTDAVNGEPVRVGAEVLDRVEGTLPAERVEALLALGEGTGTYEVSYALTPDDELRSATLIGAFFEGKTSTYVLTLTDYGAPVDISTP